MIPLGLLVLPIGGSPEDDARLRAVSDVVALARKIELVCEPRVLTVPPRRVKLVPDLPIVAGQAEIVAGGYFVRYGSLTGIVRDGRTTLVFAEPERPKGARAWTQDELVGNARKVAELLKPEGFAIGESRLTQPDVPTSTYVRNEVVVAVDPRLFVGQIDMTMDPTSGMPTHVWVPNASPPAVVPERLEGILSEDELAGEAVRVHRSLPPMGPARLSGCRYTYSIPKFAATLNEMTPEHHRHVAEGAAIPLYQWRIVERLPSGHRERLVWVDARTGRAIATRTFERKVRLLSPSPAAPTVSAPDSGRWRLGSVGGTLAKTKSATFEGLPVVVTNEKRELRILRFDAKSGLVRDDSGTYRPDAALLKAMRAQKPGRPFGKR